MNLNVKHNVPVIKDEAQNKINIRKLYKAKLYEDIICTYWYLYKSLEPKKISVSDVFFTLHWKFNIIFLVDSLINLFFFIKQLYYFIKFILLIQVQINKIYVLLFKIEKK